MELEPKNCIQNTEGRRVVLKSTYSFVGASRRALSDLEYTTLMWYRCKLIRPIKCSEKIMKKMSQAALFFVVTLGMKGARCWVLHLLGASDQVHPACARRAQSSRQSSVKYLSKLPNVFVQITKCICPNCQMYIKFKCSLRWPSSKHKAKFGKLAPTKSHLTFWRNSTHVYCTGDNLNFSMYTLVTG